MAKSAAKKPLTMTFELDTSREGWEREFRRFVAALLDAGFREAVRGLGLQLLKEAKKRKLPIAAELEAVLGENREADHAS